MFAPWLDGNPLESNAPHLRSPWIRFTRVSNEQWYHADGDAAPVVLQSNNNDPTVPRRFGNRYAQRAQEAGTGRLLTVLPPVGEGHCALQPQEVDAAFYAMLAAGSAVRSRERPGR